VYARDSRTDVSRPGSLVARIGFRRNSRFKRKFSQPRNMHPRPPGRPDSTTDQPQGEILLQGDGSSVVADEVPTVCVQCSQALSLGERMFYFLEGDGASPLCHRCLASEEEGELIHSTDPLEVISWHRVDAPTAFGDDRRDASTELTRAVRSYLQEEFDHADVILDRAPSSHPDLALAQSLRAETQQLFFSGQLADAMVLLRDLRRVLVGLEQGRKRPSLAAPWDESVEELFDRVQARSSAMSRAPQIRESQDGPDLAVPLRDRRRNRSLSS